MLTTSFNNAPSAERWGSCRKFIAPNEITSLLLPNVVKLSVHEAEAITSSDKHHRVFPPIAFNFNSSWLPYLWTMHPAISAFCNRSGTRSLSVIHPPSHHISLSQPCLPVANTGPTKILPYLFLGSQGDAHCEEIMLQNGITYVLNVSISGTRPTFIQDGHFHRIPINDSYSDKLSPFFNDAFQFLDKVREANGCVLVHCLAGVSRSPTLAIAYIMHSLGMSMDEAYRYVKDKRPTISPNFNFLGQLLEYEKQLHARVSVETRLTMDGESVSKKERTANVCGDLMKDESSQSATLSFSDNATTKHTLTLTSPTTALAKLNFNQLSPLREQPSPCLTDLPSAIPLNSSTPKTVIISGLTMRIGSKHCATKRPRNDPSSSDDHGIDEAEGTCMKRPLMRPNSISFASGARVGVSRKVTLGALVPGGSQSFVLSSPAGEESSMHLDKPSQPTEGRGGEDEIQCRVMKSQVHRENLSPMKEEQISKPLRHDKSKTLANHPVNIIQSCETLTLRPNKLFLPDGNSRSQTQPCRTLTPESSKLFGALRAFESKQSDGTLTSQPADMLIIHNRETAYAEHPQVAVARKSRSLEDILNCPVPSEARNSSEQSFLFDCRHHPSYLISVLASPVTLGLDKHLLRCQTTKTDSFHQSPSSTDSLEMIPVS